MEIFEDEPRHFAEFIRLNELWIAEQFSIEEPDRLLAADPGAIVRKGGHIFSAVRDNRVLGVGALFRNGAAEFELARMAVDPPHRGQGIGRAIALHAISRARADGATSIVLLTNSKLKAAVALYYSLGFELERAGPHPHYNRCNLVMRKSLPGFESA